MLIFRDATPEDLPAIVAMLADDPLGATREDASLPLAASYSAAFDAIEASPLQRLIVAVEGSVVIGTLQLLFIPTVSRKGSWRGLIEGVRIASDHRGNGLGRTMVDHAMDLCREAGCTSVQLTSDNSRSDAHRFWKSLGFEATHIGFKRSL